MSFENRDQNKNILMMWINNDFKFSLEASFGLVLKMMSTLVGDWMISICEFFFFWPYCQKKFQVWPPLKFFFPKWPTFIFGFLFCLFLHSRRFKWRDWTYGRHVSNRHRLTWLDGFFFIFFFVPAVLNGGTNFFFFSFFFGTTFIYT